MVLLLFFSSLYFTAVSHTFHSAEIRDIREIKRYLDGKTFERVYADRQTNDKLDFLYGFKKRGVLMDLNGLKGVHPIEKGAYVITHGRGFRDLPRPIKKELSDVGTLWKKGWKLEKAVWGNTLENFKQNKPLIFYVP